MITFLVGKRNKSFEAAYQKLLDGRVPERIEFSLENQERIFDELHTPSLFGEKKVFVIIGIDEYSEMKERLLSLGERFVGAFHDAIIPIETLLVAEVKKAEVFATIQKISEPASAKDSFNPFMLANAFALGNKKETWIAYQKVLARSDEIEPLHGMIWWKLKDMFTKKIPHTREQLVNTARNLVEIYHESRRGGLSMKDRLEKFFLTNK